MIYSSVAGIEATYVCMCMLPQALPPPRAVVCMTFDPTGRVGMSMIVLC